MMAVKNMAKKQMVLEGVWKMGCSCHSSMVISVAQSVQRHRYMMLSAMCLEVYSFCQPWWLVLNHGCWGRLRDGWMVGLILVILVSCHRCSSLNPAMMPFTSLLAFSIPWTHPLNVKITINLTPFLNSENSFMQECCAGSDRGIASDVVKWLPTVDLIAHPSSPKSLKSQLQIDRITFRWQAGNIVLELAMVVVIYIMSVQLLSTFQRELKIKHSQGKVLLRAVKEREVHSGEGREVKSYSILIKFPYNVT